MFAVGSRQNPDLNLSSCCICRVKEVLWKGLDSKTQWMFGQAETKVGKPTPGQFKRAAYVYQALSYCSKIPPTSQRAHKDAQQPKMVTLDSFRKPVYKSHK